MLKIRIAEDADMASVRQLIEALEKPQEFPAESFQANYRQNLADRELTCVIAQDDGRVVAFGSLRVTSPLHHIGPVAEIVELVVDEHNRGNGIGARMIEALLSLAREKKCGMLELASNCTRQRAHQFYIRQGFSITHIKLTMDLNTGEL